MAEAAEQVLVEPNNAAEVVEVPTEGHEPIVDSQAATPGGQQAALAAMKWSVALPRSCRGVPTMTWPPGRVPKRSPRNRI